MTDAERRFHETWLGMVQPVEGLVVSATVLADAQCMERLPPSMQERVIEVCPPSRQGEAGPEGYRIADLSRLLREVLGFADDSFDVGEAIPEELSLYVPEGRQTIRPTLALKKLSGAPTSEASDATPASKAGARYELLVWDVGSVPGGVGLDLDKSETITGTWDYPPDAKFDRLLRHCRVPIGLLTNRDVVRLVYAPHGESSGSITFRLDDMASVGGRPILDAFVMLLAANRFFGVTEDRTLPAILAESRKRQANVTNELADQVFEALQILLRGFQAAAERDGRDLLDDALAREGDHLYKGLLTVLLRLVFVLYAEDRGLLPTEHPVYAKNLSLLELFEELQADRGAYPDSMSRRYGAWGRLVTLFRAIFLGLSHGDLTMPPRRGSLFNPHEYPFLEGWGLAGSAPIVQPEDRAAVKLPSVDDETVFRVLERLLLLDGQRLSYRALDVEQIGSVYEALMGFHVVRVYAEAVCVRPDRIWVTAEEVLEVPGPRRAKWLKETLGLSAAQGEKLNEELSAGGKEGAIEALSKFAAGGKKADSSLSKARPGQLVLQPGTERRRTSSHYTPRSLSTPIVRRTLEPLLAVMGKAPASERILNLKVCDPAVGSGAFLVEACRFLADQVLAAWTREGKLEAIAAEHVDSLLHARRLVAQRCLYGVDKNSAAVELAKLSLWLVTLAKDLPFTFLDHSLRHGDSLVGLDFDQIRSFHWKRGEKESKQLEMFGREIAVALDEAIVLRQQIGELGDSAVDDREKARLFWDAQDALDRVRLIGDLVVGAFFAHEKEKVREVERAKREGLVRAWLLTGGPPTPELLDMQREVRARVPVFHWMAEFPEVFYADRPDPLDENQVNRAAFMDAFVGNPPFLGGRRIRGELGDAFTEWLGTVQGGSLNADLSARFFRRCAALLGPHGTVGLLATNTIAQGDSREVGLDVLLGEDGLVVYDAVKSMPWPGSAAVSVSVVCLAKGTPREHCEPRRLDGIRVAAISSFLTSKKDRSAPFPLASNIGCSYQGCVLSPNEGFVISPEERAELLLSDLRNGERIKPLVGGEEVNSKYDQGFDRFVISFGAMPLEEAAKWPDLLQLVERRSRPIREKSRSGNDVPWWQFWRVRRDLHNAIAPLERCLVTARVTKHLCFSFQPTNRVLNEKLYVFPLDRLSPFATLQSRLHSAWTWLLSSTMKNDLNYSASDCFETFPFPKPDPRAIIPALEDIGQRLYDARAKFMVEESVGLTITYNRLKDPACTDARVLDLRALHEEMDRKVLEAYADGDPEGRWREVEVPPFCPMNDADKKKFETFEDPVIDRLFALNTKRAEEERRKGVTTAKPNRSTTKKPNAAPSKPRAPKKRKETTQEELGILSRPDADNE